MSAAFQPIASSLTRQPLGLHALAEAHGLEAVDLRQVSVDREAANALPLEVLIRNRALPYREVDGRLRVAISDPGDIAGIDELRLIGRQPLDFAVASPADIEFELRLLARSLEVGERAAVMQDTLPWSNEELADLHADDGVSDAPPIRLVNSIIVQAIEDRASDLHFLPQNDALVARIRVDGILHEVERIRKRHAAGVISRIKVLAKLDIAEHRLPQDGRFTLRPRGGGLLDVRVAIVPTVEGEGAILRLLDKTRRAPTLTDIGLSNAMQMTLEDVLYRPTGAFLAVGPTGSGKSTTIYSALSDIQRPETNIVTVENPVEYRLEDVYQMQVDNRAGMSFATGLRAILRADPDVIMVGEIRDLETAKITLEAALTGHGVLSTMHTNDAAGAITRLNDLGIEPFMTGSALNAVLAQRLVRRLCLECREPYQPERSELEDYGFATETVEAGPTLYRRRGCARCTKGYAGRIGVYQLMLVDDEVARLAVARAGHAEIVAAARAGGMCTMWEDGLEKVAAGVTTIEELSRVVR